MLSMTRFHHKTNENKISQGLHETDETKDKCNTIAQPGRKIEKHFYMNIGKNQQKV